MAGAIDTPDDPIFLLDDGASTYAPGSGTHTYYGKVGGVARIYDTGSSSLSFRGVAAFNTLTLFQNPSDVTLSYVYVIQGSNSSTFASGVHDLTSWTPVTLQQDLIAVSNVYAGTIYRYLRFKIQVTGVAPSVKVKSFIQPLDQIEDYSQYELIKVQTLMAENIFNSTTAFREWMTGTVDGGPNNDGKYPLLDGVGNSVLTKCPAQLAADYNINDPLFFGAIGDGLSHKASVFYATLADLQVKYPFATSLSQEMDYLAIQLMCNTGGNLQSQKRTYKMMNSTGDPQTPLKIISGKIDPDFGYSTLDFTAMTPNTSPVWLSSQPDFVATTGWTNASIYNDSGFIPAVFTTGVGAVCTDVGYQTAWTSRTSTADNTWTGVTRGNVYVAVSKTGTGNRVMTSANGTSWTSRTSAADNDWNSVCWAPSLTMLCAVASTGTGNRVMTSTNDGVSWTLRTSATDNNWTSICWSADLTKFVAVSSSGTGNRVMTSTNGTTWTIQTSAADYNWTSVCWSAVNAKFVAVASSGTGNRVMTSPDGVTWTLRTTPADNDWTSVCWSIEKALFVAVSATGTGNRIMTSPDGITWTIQVSPVDNDWRAVIWAKELTQFMAVSSTGTANRSMISPDGITWTTVTTGVDNDWYSLTYSSSLAKAVAISQTGTGNRVITGIKPNSFYQWGTNVTLIAGEYEVTCTVTCTRGDSYSKGNVNPPYGGIGFFSSSPGSGSNLSGKTATTSFSVTAGSTVTKTIKYTFSLTSTQTGWLTFTGGGYGNFTVTQLGVKKMVYNAAIILTRDGSAESYPPAMALRRARVRGPGRSITGARGVYYQSLVTIDGTTNNVSDLDIRGFESGIEFGNGAYLMEIRTCKIIGNKYGLNFTSGNTNAGENIRVFGGEINSNDILINSPGGSEITLYGTSLDYPDTIGVNNGQVYVGAGKLIMISVHCECRPTTVVGKPLFDFGGTVTSFGGIILLSSPLGGCVEPPIHFDTSHATWRHHDTEFYNVTDVNGLMTDGPGQMVGRMLNSSGNPNIGGMISENAASDVFNGAGQFADLTGFGDIGKKATARGTFTSNGGNGDTITIGSRTYTIKTTLTGSANEVLSGVSAATTAVNISQAINAGSGAGTQYGTGTLQHTDVSSSAGGGTISLTARVAGTSSNSIALSDVSSVFAWASTTLLDGSENIALEGGCYPYTPSQATSQWGGSTYLLARNDDYNYGTSKCAKFTKTAAGNTNGASIRIQIPVSEAHNVLGRIRFLFPQNVGTGTTPVYYRQFWVRCIGYDSLGRPKWDARTVFKGETDLTVPLVGSASWQDRKIISVYSELSALDDSNVTTYCPTWATHYAIVIDTQNLPAMSFYMADLKANLI